MNKTKKNIVIIGSTGIIGSYLYEKLRGNKFFKTIGTSSQKNIENKKYYLDLTISDTIYSFLEKKDNIDILVFTVGLAHKKGKGRDIEEFRLINYQTLVSLLNKMSELNKNPTKIIFLSSISVYGERLKNSYYDESSNPNPLSPYAKTKYDAENFLLKNYPNNSWILRLAPVYSKKFRLNINRRIKILNFYYMVGSGENYLSLLNIKNIMTVVEGVINQKIPYGIYNVSDYKKYKFKNLLENIEVRKIIIPSFMVKSIYLLGKILNNIFLVENSIKLLSDNIYSSKKLNQFIEIKYLFHNNNSIDN